MCVCISFKICVQDEVKIIKKKRILEDKKKTIKQQN